MRNVGSAALLCCLMACAGASPPPSSASGGETGAHPLAWLEGRWRGEGTATTPTSPTETWVIDTDGTLRGVGHTFDPSGRGGHHELLRIERRGDGWTYEAAPAGQAPAEFPLVRVSADEAVFENPAHDFPKRIHYRREGDTLTATISGTADQRRATWTFTRVGDAEPLMIQAAEVCVDDDGRTLVTLPPCHCASMVFCRIRGSELDLAMHTGRCEACEEPMGRCDGNAERIIPAGARCATVRAAVLTVLVP